MSFAKFRFSPTPLAISRVLPHPELQQRLRFAVAQLGSCRLRYPSIVKELEHPEVRHFLFVGIRRVRVEFD